MGALEYNAYKDQWAHPSFKAQSATVWLNQEGTEITEGVGWGEEIAVTGTYPDSECVEVMSLL